MFNALGEKLKEKSDLDLVICPKGAMGGHDDKLIEIFFSMKYHSWERTVGDNLQVTEKAKLIYGARLEYHLTDNGHVLCLLRPSRTDNFKPPEDGILLGVIKQPSQLKQKAKRHWKYLVSYMRVTDVDSNPSFGDSIRVCILRSIKNRIKDGAEQPRNIMVFMERVSQWVVSVGLSGLLIFVTTLYLNKSSENEAVIKLTELSKQQKAQHTSILSSLTSINASINEVGKISSVLEEQKTTSERLENQINTLTNRILKQNKKNHDETMKVLQSIQNNHEHKPDKE